MYERIIPMMSQPPAEVVVFGDNFNDNSLDASKWARIGAVAGYTVVEQNQRIEITSGTTSGADGLVSLNSWDMTTGTGRYFRGEPQYTVSATQACYFIAIDASNRYFGIVRNGVGGNLSFEYNNGASSVTAVGYDGVQHKWQRCKYDVSGNQMLFETSPDNVTWTTRRTVGSWTSLGFTMTALKFRFQLNSASNGGVFLMDNFALKDN